MCWIFTQCTALLFASDTKKSVMREVSNGSLSVTFTAKCQAGTGKELNPLHLRKYDFMPCTMRPHKNRAVDVTTCKYSKKQSQAQEGSGYPQCGPWWRHEQPVWNSINSGKHDKSFRHAITSWSGSHSSSIWWQNWCQEQITQHLTDPPKTNCQPLTHPCRKTLMQLPSRFGNTLHGVTLKILRH